MLALLRQHDFGRLWLGGLISMAGDWLLQAALPFFVFQRTGSTMATAAIIAAELAPNLLLTTFAGVYVDRWDRKRVMVVTSALQAVAVLALLAIDGTGAIWIAFAVVLVQATLSTLFGPAENALLPRLVEPDELVTANALNSLNNSLARVIGAPLGGLLLGWWGLGAVAIIDAATFALGAALIATIRKPGVVVTDAGPVERPDFWREWREGLALIWRGPTVLTLCIVLLVMNFGGVMIDPLFAPFVNEIVGVGAEAFGWILTARGLGGIVGGLVVGRLGSRLSPVHLVSIGSVVAGCLLLVEIHLPLLAVVLAISFLVGIPAVAASTGIETLLQQAVPDRYRGRVYGSLSTTVALVALVSVLGFGGVLGELLGIVPVLTLAASLTIGAGIVAALALTPRRARRAPESAARPGTERG